MKYEIEIQGTTDYLQNRCVFIQKEEGVRKRRTGVSEESLEAKIEDKMYYDKKGAFIPSKHIEGCLIKASKDFKIEGRRGKTYKDIFKGLVWCLENEIRFHPNKRKEDYVHSEITRNPATGGRNLTKRPAFKRGWKARFILEVGDPTVSKAVIKSVIENGGLSVGIGDWRPKYGRFEVTKFKELKK